MLVRGVGRLLSGGRCVSEEGSGEGSCCPVWENDVGRKTCPTPGSAVVYRKFRAERNICFSYFYFFVGINE